MQFASDRQGALPEAMRQSREAGAGRPPDMRAGVSAVFIWAMEGFSVPVRVRH
jgi:hypothetical protein